jgi:hypothetical protein
MNQQCITLTEGVFIIPGFLTREQCEQYIRQTEQIGYAPAPVSTVGGPRMMPEVRDNERVMVDDTEQALWLWEKLRGSMPANIDPQGRGAVGVNERLRFYRYQPGQRFKIHTDGYYQRDNGERSLLTFMVYLNNVPKGGETAFKLPGANLLVSPVQGTCLLFLHHLWHEGVAVQDGLKYVLRSDVMFPPQ